MSKDYSDYKSTSLKSYDKSIIVEELLEKLKAQGCFDAKRKQFLSEITNKSTYQNLHTKVENLATKFLETVRWPPSVQKHQLREQLRLHIQSTDQFNNCVSRLIEQEVNCKIQAELKPMIESKACEYLEVNYEKWKQNMLTQIYENFQSESSPTDKFNNHKGDMKKEASYNGEPRSLSKDIDGSNDLEVTQSNNSDRSTNKPHKVKQESNLNQSNIVNSSSYTSTSIKSHSKLSLTPPKSSGQQHMINSNFITSVPPTMPPPIGLLPPPHRILPNNPFQPLPPPPPPMFLPIERFPPPPPPEDKSLPPPPPPPENGPNTPTEEYNPKFYEAPECNAVEKIKTGLLKTPDKAIDKTTDAKIISPKKMIWGHIVLAIQDISDDSASDSDKNEHERRKYSRRSPHHQRSSDSHRDIHVKHYEELRPKEPWRHQERNIRQPVTPRSHPKSNEYTDVSSESFNEIEFKDAPQPANTQMNVKKATSSSTSEDSHSSSSNDQTLDLIRKINKKKTKLRKRQKTPTLIQSSSSYSSSESSSESSSSEHSQGNHSPNNYQDNQDVYREFGRSQSDEKDMDISVETQSPQLEFKHDSPLAEINLGSVESVQMRKNQIKARLEEIDAKRSLLQKQQMLTLTVPCSVSNSSSSTDSSSDNTSSSPDNNDVKSRDKDSKKSTDGIPKSLLSPKSNQNTENDSALNQLCKSETIYTENLENNDLKLFKNEHDSEPEEGELSSESRAGSLKREINVNETEETKSFENTISVEKEGIKQEADALTDDIVDVLSVPEGM